jgi:hypothetical protein
VTGEELRTQLRRQDIDDPREVEETYLETGGETSVVKEQTRVAPGRSAKAPEREIGTLDEDGEQDRAGPSDSTAPPTSAARNPETTRSKTRTGRERLRPTGRLEPPFPVPG